MLIRLSTVQFNGFGSIDCRRCNRKTKFPDGAAVVILDYQLFQIVKSADTLSTLHRCGRDYFWECDTCGGCEHEEDIMRRRSRRWQVMSCSCGGTFERHEEPLAVEPDPAPDHRSLSPF